MRTRKQALGDMNIIGAKVEQQRKAIGMKQKDLLAQLQIRGIDLNASGLSKLEGQLRGVADYELKAIFPDILTGKIRFIVPEQLIVSCIIIKGLGNGIPEAHQMGAAFRCIYIVDKAEVNIVKLKLI